MKEKIKNKEVKEYRPGAAPNTYKIGDVVYFKKFRDWQTDGQIVEGVYGEVVDIHETRDNFRHISVSFGEFKAHNETKIDPGVESRDFVVGLVEEK
ncbi:MAG: hypothetical protein ACREJQ_06615 [bacterium]